jgi:TRAP-type mannitol/chloroaromatic compound transport system permease small subunit
MTALLALSRAIDGRDRADRPLGDLADLSAILGSATNAVMPQGLHLLVERVARAAVVLFGAAFMLAAPTPSSTTSTSASTSSTAPARGAPSTGSTLFRARLLPHALRPPDGLDDDPLRAPAWRSGQVSTNAGGLVIWPARHLSRRVHPLSLRDLEIIKKIA